MASRRKGRILAFQALYSWEAAGVPPGESSISGDLLDFSWLEKVPDKGVSDFSRLLVMGTIENINRVDAMIRSHLKNWDFSRLNRVDLAVLRMSAYTLMFQDDVPPSIVIDEAIGISKEFGTDDSYRFINGVLDSIRKTIQKEKAAGNGSSG
ncbi:MAG: transcription antitermination factor NusB [Spirochaetaceae bacterium]|jgi:N utilization substance protein B|nr:transcription antitermination factor NusB [Spirochaetaceae bacterium]